MRRININGYGGANPFPPRTTRLRTTDTPGIAPSDGDAFIEDADAPLPHTTNKKYLQPGTEFCIGVLDSGLQISTGPQSGGEIDGLPISTQRQVFVIDLASLGADPVFGDPLGIGLAAADLTQLGAIAFGFRHEGPNTDPINSGLFLHPDFYVDDVYLLHNRPGLSVGGSDFTLDEAIGSDAISLTLTLSAEPTDDVTVSAVSLDTSEGTVVGGAVPLHSRQLGHAATCCDPGGRRRAL